jgi:predicted O-methyltransferase YrrM
MPVTEERWDGTSAYLQSVFGAREGELAALSREAAAHGLPSISISSDVGQLLSLMARLASAGRESPLAIELGTLGGYSGAWIARGLGAGGRLITVEVDEKHARFAEGWFARLGLSERVRVERGAAIEVVKRLARELGPESVDLVFADAVKMEYEEYFRLCKPMVRPGGLYLADNTLGSTSWWITDSKGSDPARDAVDRFNRVVAADPDFESVVVPSRQGVMIARKRDSR